MKHAFTKIMWVVLGAAALVSCNSENPEVSSAVRKQVAIKLGTTDILDAAGITRAEFADETVIRWESDDRIQIVWDGGSTELGNPVLSEDRYEATFSGTVNEAAGYVIRTKFNLTEEFVYPATLTQPAAGEMDKNGLHLQSGIQFASLKGVTSEGAARVHMQIAGTILRVLPYTTTYGEEHVQSVTLTATTPIAGTVKFNYVSGEIGKWGDSPFYNGSNSVSVGLTQPFSLAGVPTRAQSHGIYIPLPLAAGTVSSYTVVVKTDAAEYTYSSQKVLTVTSREVIGSTATSPAAIPAMPLITAARRRISPTWDTGWCIRWTAPKEAPWWPANLPTIRSSIRRR